MATIPIGAQNNLNWVFPLDTGPQGFFETNQDIVSATKENLKMVLFTNPGERIVVCQYGAGMQEFLFEPNSVEKKSKIQSVIQTSIQRWVKNVVVNKVSVVYQEDLIIGNPLYGKVTLADKEILVVLQYTISAPSGNFFIPNQSIVATFKPFIIQTP